MKLHVQYFSIVLGLRCNSGGSLDSGMVSLRDKDKEDQIKAKIKYKLNL